MNDTSRAIIGMILCVVIGGVFGTLITKAYYKEGPCHTALRKDCNTCVNWFTNSISNVHQHLADKAKAAQAQAQEQEQGQEQPEAGDK